MSSTSRGQRPKRAGGDRLMTLAELCDELGITRSTFYEWRAKNRAPASFKLPNGELRIRRTVFENWISSLERRAA